MLHALSRLRDGQTVVVDGQTLRALAGPVGPGDLYIGQRGHEPRLLTCKSVHPKRWVVPTDPAAYSFDTVDTIRVERLDGGAS